MKGDIMDFITVPQAAELLNYTRQYTWSLIKAGKLKAKKVGKIYILTEAEVNRIKKLINKRKEVE